MSILKKIIHDTQGTQPFVMLYRPRISNNKQVEVLLTKADHAVDLPSLKNQLTRNSKHFTIIPYCQLKTRGYECVDDKQPLWSMPVIDEEKIDLDTLIKQLPQTPLNVDNPHFDLDDGRYAEIVQQVINNEIGGGEGANFVMKRQFLADIQQYSIHKALSIFRQLLCQEKGAYWTFIINTGSRVIVGASPELHVRVENQLATMNPISGTYRYPSEGATLESLLQYLSHDKEKDELSMVVEEELKMISKFCKKGGSIVGPFLKEMSTLAHTEYLIQGKTTADPLTILQETLFAPTVTGSPLENACRVIKRYEPKGRGYYSGVAALIETSDEGQQNLDSTILIRMADIDKAGHTKIGVGATIVRHSDPMSEAAETKAKATALLGAMNIGGF